MRACWLKWVGRDWSISADYIWLNYSDANSADGVLVVMLVGQNSVVETHATDADISMSGMEVWDCYHPGAWRQKDTGIRKWTFYKISE